LYEAFRNQPTLVTSFNAYVERRAAHCGTLPVATHRRSTRRQLDRAPAQRAAPP
jgi:hypothetical protein